MKTFLNKIVFFFKDKAYPYIKKITSKLSFKDWLLIILAIMCIIFFFRMRYFCEKSWLLNMIYNDSISVYLNKIGEQYKKINSYIVSINELKELNTELYKEVLNLKEHPLIITKTETKFRIDTLKLEVEKPVAMNESIYRLNWQYNKEPEYFTLSGYTDVHNTFASYNTVLNNLLVNNELTLDVIDDGKNLSVIAKSSNPYVNITGMESIMIDPKTCPSIKNRFKQKRWGIGPSIGICVDKNMKVTPYIGIGAHYNIFVF